MRSKIHKLLRWAATMSLAAFSVAAGLFLQGLGNASVPVWHARFFYGSLAVTVILAVLYMLIGDESKHQTRPSVSSPGDGSNATGGDNKGIQAAFAHAVVGDSALDRMFPKHTSIPAPPITYPALDFHFAIPETTYTAFHGYWELTADYAPDSDCDKYKSLIIWVSNPRPPVGEAGHRAGNVFAHIEFAEAHFGTPLYQVDRAYWLKEGGYQISINVAEKKAVVIGNLRGEEWIAYTNEHRDMPHGEWRGSGRQLTNETPLPIDRGLHITVSVIASKTNHTIGEAKFGVVFLEDGSFTVRQL